MNVGYPNVSGQTTLRYEGVGYAHISEDTRKGKSGRSEGALLLIKTSHNIYQTKLIEMNQEKVGADGQGRLINRCRSEIQPAERVQILQGKLYQKAK